MQNLSFVIAPSRCSRRGRTSHQLGTHLNNPSDQEHTEIEVTDPTHPLFGRRFPLLSVSDPARSVGHVFVSYRAYMVLRIETAATDLVVADARRTSPTTKLTSQSVTELVELAEQCEVLRVRPTTGGLGRTLPRTPSRSHRGDVHRPTGGDR